MEAKRLKSRDSSSIAIWIYEKRLSQWSQGSSRDLLRVSRTRGRVSPRVSRRSSQGGRGRASAPGGAGFGQRESPGPGCNAEESLEGIRLSAGYLLNAKSLNKSF